MFRSQTDTEVVAHLIDRELQRGKAPREAVATVLPRLHGAFAMAFLFRNEPDLLIGARLGAPLTVGYGEGENYLGSDAHALAPLTTRIAYLDEGDWACVSREKIEIYDRDNKPVTRPIVHSGAIGRDRSTRATTRHFMLKEIYEQPVVVAQTLRSYLRPVEQMVALPDMDFDLSRIERVAIVACGTASYVGMIGKYWIEQFARLPVEVDVASEFRYRDPVLLPHTLGVVISQSGETADTLAALRHMRANGVDHRGHHQRADQLDGARGRPAAFHPRRPRDRRRLDQGVHLPARGDGGALGQSRARQGAAAARRGARDRPPPDRGTRRDQRRARA